MSSFINSTEVTISDVVRLTFFEVVNHERTEIVKVAMSLDHLVALRATIDSVLSDHDTQIKSLSK